MKNHNIGLLGGGMEQAALANRLAEDGGRQVYAMFLEGALLSPKVHTVRDFRDALWLCSVLVLPDPVCREGLLLNAPLWQEAPVDVGQFLGDIGKGVLLLAGCREGESHAYLHALHKGQDPEYTRIYHSYEEKYLASLRELSR